MTEHSAWDAAGRARVSDRWAQFAALWNRAMTEALLSAAALSPDSVVLDLAAGSGDPAFTIAGQLNGGYVIALDSSHSSISVARERAQQLGLDSKVKCVQADAQAIPLARDSVDRVTCRCGIMFFRNTGTVLSELLRVLKPGGSVAFLAWAAFEQPFFLATVGVVLQRVAGARMPSEALEMFRFAVAGSLQRALKAAGFRNIREQSLTVPRIWSGSPEALWVYQQEVSTLCQPLFGSIPKDSRVEIDRAVSEALSRFRSGSVLSVPVNVIVAAGERGV
jgi:ubiquinone/menaquinone biosynthesis C-methylase UbiE